MRLTVPTGRKRKPPRVVIPTERVRRSGDLAGVPIPSGEFDVGAGPWFVKGKKASLPEYRVAKVLAKLGREFQFQVSKFGGRAIAGGQVLDFIVDDSRPIVYVDVRGYWHKGAAGEANDARKIFHVRAAAPHVKIVIVWQEQTEREENLMNFLRQEVGSRGGSRTAP